MQRLVVLSLAFTSFMTLSVAACSSGGSDDGTGGEGGDSSGGTASSGGSTSSGGTSSGGSSGGSDAGGNGGMGGLGGSSGLWQGSTPHIELSGTLAGNELAVDVTGDDAADIGTAYCERNYIVPDLDDSSTWVDGYLEKVELKLNFFYEDALAEFQMELVHPELLTSEGVTFSVPGDAEANFGLTTDVDGPSEEEFEDAAVGGTVTLELFSGEPGEDGLVPNEEGVYGAYVDLELEAGGSFQGSFTVNCGQNDLEVPE